MVTHGGGQGLRVPRKRVELVGAMLLQEENSITSWNNKAIGASRDEGFQPSELSDAVLDRTFSPPLRAGDDFKPDSDEGLYPTDAYGPYDQVGYYANREAPVQYGLDGSLEPTNQQVGDYSNREASIQLGLDVSHERTYERQDMKGVEEEVADSELQGTHFTGVADEYEVDIGFDELRSLIPFDSVSSHQPQYYHSQILPVTSF